MLIESRKLRNLTRHEKRAYWSCSVFCSIDSKNNMTFWVTFSYSVSSFIFPSLRITGHGNPDNNLESLCISTAPSLTSLQKGRRDNWTVPSPVRCETVMASHLVITNSVPLVSSRMTRRLAALRGNKLTISENVLCHQKYFSHFNFQLFSNNAVTVLLSFPLKSSH
jgi:hypothetical protein